MYVRIVNDQKLTLRVSGKLWMRSLVMSDVETGTEWSHLLGRAMSGELKGRELTPIVTEMLTWAAWRRDFPETTVLSMPNTSENYTADFYRRPEKFVFGFESSGRPFALPMEELIEKPVHSFQIGEETFVASFDRTGFATRLFDAQVDDRTLSFEAVDDATMRDTQTGSTWSVSSGRAIAGDLAGTELKQHVGIMSFRFAWKSFHPKSTDVEF